MKGQELAYAAALAGVAAAQSSGSPPEGCTPSYNGTFQITVSQESSSSNTKRQAGILELTLADGVLKDSQGRTGYIASNNQFQFDNPPQPDAITASGFSACDDDTLALGASKVFYQCRSGDFYNLYNSNVAPQCEAVSILIEGDDSDPPSDPPVSEGADGQPQATSGGGRVSQIGDGQIQAPTGAAGAGAGAGRPISQIGDGQIQAPTGRPSFGSGSPCGGASPCGSNAGSGSGSRCGGNSCGGNAGSGNAGAGGAVSQINDGQIQVPTSRGAASITVRPPPPQSSGQVPASTGKTPTTSGGVKPTSGQASASTAKPTSQAPTSSGKAPTSSGSAPATSSGKVPTSSGKASATSSGKPASQSSGVQTPSATGKANKNYPRQVSRAQSSGPVRQIADGQIQVEGTPSIPPPLPPTSEASSASNSETVPPTTASGSGSATTFSTSQISPPPLSPTFNSSIISPPPLTPTFNTSQIVPPPLTPPTSRATGVIPPPLTPPSGSTGGVPTGGIPTPTRGTVPASDGFKVVPGTMAALILGVAGAFFYL